MIQLGNQPTPIIDLQRCNGCGFCVLTCPTKALNMRDGKTVVSSPWVCEYRGLCEAVCPTQAISRPFEIVFSEEEEISSNSTKVVENN